MYWSLGVAYAGSCPPKKELKKRPVKLTVGAAGSLVMDTASCEADGTGAVVVIYTVVGSSGVLTLVIGAVDGWVRVDGVVSVVANEVTVPTANVESPYTIVADAMGALSWNKGRSGFSAKGFSASTLPSDETYSP